LSDGGICPGSSHCIDGDNKLFWEKMMATSADDLEQQLIQRLMSARATGASVRCAPMLVLSSEDIEIIIDAFHDRTII